MTREGSAHIDFSGHSAGDIAFDGTRGNRSTRGAFGSLTETFDNVQRSGGRNPDLYNEALRGLQIGFAINRSPCQRLAPGMFLKDLVRNQEKPAVA